MDNTNIIQMEQPTRALIDDVQLNRKRYKYNLNRGKSFPIRNPTYVKCGYVKDINWDFVRPLRGGIIVYTTVGGILHFGMGIDSKSGDITDFGGGIRYRKDRTAIIGSLREFMEESLCVFGSFHEDDVSNCVAVYSRSMVIIFIHLDIDPDITCEKFDRRVKMIANPEISKLVWICKNNLDTLLANPADPRLYYRVSNLLSKGKMFFDLI